MSKLNPTSGLSFELDFRCALVPISIAINTEISVINPFYQSGRLPRIWFEVNRKQMGILTAGTAAWTAKQLTFRNRSTTAGQIVDSQILFFLD